jgi:isoquinoline 1-oxidoreductase alpha subunit
MMIRFARPGGVRAQNKPYTSRTFPHSSRGTPPEQERFMPTLRVNGKQIDVNVEPEMPLLWVLRDELGLTGTKYACGIAACGACTVLVDGQPVRSCVMPVSAVEGKAVTTIEGLSKDGNHPVQKAWVQLQVPQCGYCQSGMILAAAALLAENKTPTDADIEGAMTNLCRCGTYHRVRQAIHLAAKSA